MSPKFRSQCAMRCSEISCNGVSSLLRRVHRGNPLIPASEKLLGSFSPKRFEFLVVEIPQVWSPKVRICPEKFSPNVSSIHTAFASSSLIVRRSDEITRSATTNYKQHLVFAGCKNVLPIEYNNVYATAIKTQPYHRRRPDRDGEGKKRRF